MATGKRWAQDELLIALNLYHKLTFGQMHARQPAILEIAARMGRSPGSLAMKLCNFASLDPVLKLRGIRGLTGTSELDESTWAEFHENISEAAPASETAFRRLFDVNETEQLEVVPQMGVRVFEPPPGPTERYAATKVRLKQDYFRQIVLNNFDGRCGITGLPVRELLIASHT